MSIPATQEGPPAQGEALSGRVTSLEAALAKLIERVSALEAQAHLLPAPTPEMPAAAISTLEPAPLPALPSGVLVLSLVGKVCLVLGGAYFIRALVDAGTLRSASGAALGLAYAAAWALIALRARQSIVASFDTLASILIAYPLLVESTIRFGILPPALSAFLLMAVTALHATVAWRRDLQPMVWIATLASVGAGFVMMIASRALEPFLAVLLLLGLGSLWLTPGRKWSGLRWPTALAADLGLLLLVLLAAWAGGRPPKGYRDLSPTRGMLFAVVLTLGYLGTFAWRMRERGRVLRTFERVQSFLVLLVGFGGALRLALASGSGAGVLGIGAALAGAGCYVAAIPFAEDVEETRANFNFFTTLGMILLILGGPVLLPLPLCGILAGLAGAGAMFAGLRLQRTSLLIQCGIYLAAAAGVSGLAPWTFKAFLDPGGSALPPSISGLVVLGTLVGAATISLLRPSPDGFRTHLRPLILLLGAVIAAGLGALAIWAFSLVQGPGAAEPSRLALTRTGVLSLLTIGLAWLGRRFPALELRWLVYPFLVLAALKFLFEDMPAGHPLTLFLAFMFLGATFIFAPRLLKVNP